MTSQINIQHLLWMWCTLLLIAILVYDLLHRHFDGDGRIVFTELNRIVHQIIENLLDFTLVSIDSDGIGEEQKLDMITTKMKMGYMMA